MDKDSRSDSKEKQTNDLRLIAAIGASAGGIPALQPLLKALPVDAPVAYLLLQHTDPTRMAELEQVLRVDCLLPLSIAQDRELLRAGHIYLIPSDQDCELDEGCIRLLPSTAKSGTRHAIDRAMTSLAEHSKENAIGVILSGTGFDGTQGMRTIKAVGGITLVQDLASAEYRGMPQAVITAGLADFILSPEQIAGEIGRIAHWCVPKAEKQPIQSAAVEAVVNEVRQRTGFDFSQYKVGTLQRRLARRMLVAHCDSVDEYHALISTSGEEATALVCDLLISVTGFFRDAEAFHTLARELRPLVESRRAGDAIRVWVPGCATGEEAYTIAIVLAELLGERLEQVKVQIFATDVDARAIPIARKGAYDSEQLQAVSGPLRRRYFEFFDEQFWVRREVRDMVVFAEHDLIQDPPFTKMDLISCRNVLIYFKRPLQEQLLTTFHFALKTGGYLFLGSSESANHLFERLDDKSKIFRRLEVDAQPPTIQYRRANAPALPKVSVAQRLLPPAERVRMSLLSSYAPPCVLVNANQQVVFVHGELSPFLRLAQGETNLKLLSMATTAQIRVELRQVLSRVARYGTRSVSHPASVPNSEPPTQVTVVGVPAGDEYVLILFEQSAAQAANAVESGGVQIDDTQRMLELEKELAANREHLHANIEELETANEELQSINEEFQSMTEELQSTVEERQSTNEELTTVNDELAVKSAALESANADMQGVLDNVAAAILVLDDKLHLSRYSLASKQLFELGPMSIGQPLVGIEGVLDLGLLTRVINEAASTRRSLVQELSVAGKAYEARVIPRADPAGKPAGLIIAFTDASERRREQAALEAAVQASETANLTKTRFLAAASHDLRQPLQSLSMYLATAMNAQGDEQRNASLVKMDQSLKGLRSLLNALLDISRLDSGQIRPAFQDFAINDILEQICAQAAGEAQARGLKLRRVSCSGSVHTDPALLEAMLSNLVFNAVKHTSKGGAVVGCRRRGDFLRIDICDTGPGIAAENQSEIFEEFAQLPAARAGNFGGLGLGLSIVRRLSELLELPVELSSRVGFGTRFSVTVPCAKGAPRPVALKPKQEKTRLNGRVLLVDDHDDVRDATAQFLAISGLVVDGAAGLEDALRLAAEQAPDILVVDFWLHGGCTGLDVIKQVREVLGKPKLPAILVTGETQGNLEAKAREAGCYLLLKPVDAPRLWQMIRELTANQ